MIISSPIFFFKLPLYLIQYTPPPQPLFAANSSQYGVGLEIIYLFMPGFWLY